MEVVFSSPNYLWFLIVIPILIFTHIASTKYSTKKALKFANFPAIERVTGNKIITKNLNTLILRSIILTLVVIAASGATLNYSKRTSISDYALAIDASSSMLADDYSPNRLEAAKEAALVFIDELPARSKVAIVSFAGTSFVESPLTEDKQKLKEAISLISSKKIGGTDIGEAIVTSVNLISQSESSKTIILLTDGRTNVGEIIPQAIAYANENRVSINSIGIGTTEGGNIADEITLTLDEDTLKRIATQTSGIYVRADSKEELKEVYANMIELTSKKVSISLSIISMIAALFLLMTEWSLINTRYKILP